MAVRGREGMLGEDVGGEAWSWGWGGEVVQKVITVRKHRLPAN